MHGGEGAVPYLGQLLELIFRQTPNMGSGDGGAGLHAAPPPVPAGVGAEGDRYRNRYIGQVSELRLPPSPERAGVGPQRISSTITDAIVIAFRHDRARSG